MTYTEKINKIDKLEKGMPMELEFLNEIRTVDTIEIVRNMENNWFGEFNLTYGNDATILRLVKDIFDELTWYEIMDEAWAQNPLGMYARLPWQDIDENGDNITKALLKNHIRLTDDGIVEFYNPTDSPLYQFFLKHRTGYGKNISTSINGLLHAIRYIIAANFRDAEFARNNMQEKRGE